MRSVVAEHKDGTGSQIQNHRKYYFVGNCKLRTYGPHALCTQRYLKALDTQQQLQILFEAISKK